MLPGYLWAPTFRLSVLLFLLLLLGLLGLWWLLKHNASKHSTPPTQSPIRHTCSEKMSFRRLPHTCGALLVKGRTNAGVFQLKRYQIKGHCVGILYYITVLLYLDSSTDYTKDWNNMWTLKNKDIPVLHSLTTLGEFSWGIPSPCLFSLIWFPALIHNTTPHLQAVNQFKWKVLKENTYTADFWRKSWGVVMI